MSSDRLYSDFLRDMLDNSQKAIRFIEGLSFEEFKQNEEKIYAVIRAIEIIGEAARQIPKHLRAKYKKIPWDDMTGMRDRMIHKYFGIKLDLVWETVRRDLPTMQTEVKKMLAEVLKQEEEKDK